jgi:hypothetical protein
MIDAAFVTNTVATLILAGMLLIPFANLLVGACVGGSIGGFAGFTAGVLIATAITFAEIVLTRGPRTSVGEVQNEPARPDADDAATIVYLDKSLPDAEDIALSEDRQQAA